MNSSPTRAYVLGKNVVAQGDGTNGLLYLLKDGQGSTRALIRADGSLAEQYNYDAFGTLLSSNGAQSDASAAMTSWLFAGDGVFDPASGWTYHLARFTNGFWFTSMDSMQSWPGGVSNANLYRSDGSNPISLTDPSGHDDGSEQSFGLADEYTAGELGGFSQVITRLNHGFTAISIDNHIENTLGVSSLMFGGGNDVVASLYGEVTGLSGWLGEDTTSIIGAFFQGAWAGVVGFADNFTFHQISGLHDYRNAYWQDIGLAGTSTETWSNAFSWTAVAAFDLAFLLSGSSGASGCFVAGTPVLLGDGSTEEAINDIQVGQRVATDGGVANSADGKTEAADPNSTEVDPATWREVTIDAGDWQVQALEPLSWISSNHVEAGGSIDMNDLVDLSEMGVPTGLIGTVESVTACPTIQGGPGRVVLTTVSHLNDFLYDLTLTDVSGQAETLGVSGYHRFYDQSFGWVDVQNLHNGEILRGDHGDLTVTGIVRESGSSRVYNMTVETDHVYYVGDLNRLARFSNM